MLLRNLFITLTGILAIQNSIAQQQEDKHDLKDGKYIRIRRDADTVFTTTPTIYPTTATPVTNENRTIIEQLDTVVVSHYTNGRLDGMYQELDSNGTVIKQGEHLNDVKQGMWYNYDLNGTLQEEGEFRNGELKGHWYRWTPNKKGKLKKRKIV